MKDWITNYMIMLLSEHENKLAEILGMLSIAQCVMGILMGLMMIALYDIQSKLERLRSKNGK